MTTDLSSFFSPKSVAVIGASRSQEKVGAIVLKNIIDSKFTGKIFPINPEADEINSLKSYPNVNSLPETPDLAIIAIPAINVSVELEACGKKGIKNVVVLSAGYKETGTEGARLENQLFQIGKKYGINLLGPNCLGFVNNKCPINATFAKVNNISGNLRFISQSGALAASIFDWCSSNSIGFDQFITIGNKTVINENDVLSYLNDLDKETGSMVSDGLSNFKPIGLYLESISNGPEFLKITKEISRNNPVFLIKPGKTKAAVKAMQSHTGSIAGEDSVLNAVIKNSGIIRAETLEDFFDLAKGFSWETAPLGPKVAVISNAGGPAVISSDAIVKEGLELAEFDDKTKQQLEQILPRTASVLNPVDVLGDALADRIFKSAQIVLQTDQVDVLLVILTPQLMTQIDKTAELIGSLSKTYKKPIFCSFIGGEAVLEGIRKLNGFKIPSFSFPERAIATIGKMYEWKKYQQEEEKENVQDTQKLELSDLKSVKEIIETAVKNNHNALDSIQASRFLSLCGFSAPEITEISNYEQAKISAENFGWPVVLKISSPNILHKTELGGVVTEISNDEELKNAWDKLSQIIGQLDQKTKDNTKILIQKDIENGVEVIAGVKNDPTFGPILLFGAGGTLAELILDRNIHLLPLNITQAKKLVGQSKIISVLKGYRGGSAYALDRLYELLVRLSKITESFPQISQVEINPIIVTLNDTFAVDGKIILKQTEVILPAGPKFKEAIVATHDVLAGNYHYFVLQTDIPLVYSPGQYISVKVADSRINSYSIAGHEGNNFSLLVDTTPGGPGSQYFQNLKTADKISFLGPFGIFNLKPDDGAKQILFLGTGSGCSPLRSILESALKEKKTNLPITLYFGLRYKSDVFWQDYFEKLAQEYPNFKFKLVLSKPDETWQGQVGHITEFVQKDFPNTNDCSAYLCGNKQMIEQASEILLAHGCPKERIYSEKF